MKNPNKLAIAGVCAQGASKNGVKQLDFEI
jgi:hypothetical protein